MTPVNRERQWETAVSIVSRFGRRSFLVGLGALGGCGFLRDDLSSFGSAIALELDDVRAHFETGAQFLYVPQARAWVVEVPPDLADRFAGADNTLAAAAENGYRALFQKCPHLGCRVPECQTSGLFECPCHGSKYTRWGEKVDGPAPRGMDRFASRIQGDKLLIDTGNVIQGLAIGVHPSGAEAEGPLCVPVEDHS